MLLLPPTCRCQGVEGPLNKSKLREGLYPRLVLVCREDPYPSGLVLTGVELEYLDTNWGGLQDAMGAEGAIALLKKLRSVVGDSSPGFSTTAQ